MNLLAIENLAQLLALHPGTGGAFPLVATNVWAVTVEVFLIGMGGALATVLQTD